MNTIKMKRLADLKRKISALEKAMPHLARNDDRLIAKHEMEVCAAEILALVETKK